jgi:hypothetical protein
MHGSDEQTGSLFSYVSCEARVPLGCARPSIAVATGSLDMPDDLRNWLVFMERPLAA